MEVEGVHHDKSARREVNEHVTEQTAAGSCQCSHRFDKGTAIALWPVHVPTPLYRVGDRDTTHCVNLLRDVSGARGQSYHLWAFGLRNQHQAQIHELSGTRSFGLG